LRRDAASFPVFAGTAHWAINVLASTQVNLARKFCGPLAERFEGVTYHDGLGGAPLLNGAIARLECSAFHGVDGGDHHIFLGRVEEYATGEGAPLLFHGGSFGDWLPHTA
jgi:flavin reductase (DIM6/NTAB) family NADH-FMN oxidoreductase RutF